MMIYRLDTPTRAELFAELDRELPGWRSVNDDAVYNPIFELTSFREFVGRPYWAKYDK